MRMRCTPTFENYDWDDQILKNINQAEEFLDLLDVVRDSPPRPFRVVNRNDRERLGLLLDLTGDARPPIGAYSSVGFSRNHDDPDPNAFPVRNIPAGPGPSGGAEAAGPAPGGAEPPEEEQAPSGQGTPGPWLPWTLRAPASVSNRASVTGWSNPDKRHRPPLHPPTPYQKGGHSAWSYGSLGRPLPGQPPRLPEQSAAAVHRMFRSF